MASRTRTTIAQTQRLSLNTGLSAAIRVLRADAAGLTAWLEDQAAQNPRLLILPAPLPPASEWLPRWSGSFDRAAAGAQAADLAAAPDPSLTAHVAAGLAALRLPPAQARFGERLIDALEPSGWLGQPLPAMAAEAGLTPPEAEAVLQRLQTLEPTGIFARDLAECLRLQADEAGELDPVMDGVLARLSLVAAGALDRIARALGTTVDDVALRVRRLRRYDPKPGARFQQGAAAVAEPDLVVRRGESGWEISLNRSSLPSLSVSDAKGPGLGAARAVIRLVEGRNATLLSVARDILRRQEAALDSGLGALVPMIMADVAEGLGLHQTTVSRVVAGAAVDTPLGTWWLRAMFSPAVRQGAPSGAALRDAMARMVAEEDARDPLTDDALARQLAGVGAPLARRTVAKYRAMLGIPAAHLRRRRAAERGPK